MSCPTVIYGRSWFLHKPLAYNLKNKIITLVSVRKLTKRRLTSKKKICSQGLDIRSLSQVDHCKYIAWTACTARASHHHLPARKETKNNYLRSFFKMSNGWFPKLVQARGIQLFKKGKALYIMVLANIQLSDS